MARRGYENHYGISSYSTPIEEVIPLLPEMYHAPIRERIEDVRTWINHYGYESAERFDTRNASFLRELGAIIPSLRSACFQFLKGQFLYDEEWHFWIMEELELDILDQKYHPIQIAGMPESEETKHPFHGRKLTNIHKIEDVTVALEWDYNGEWPNYWIAFYPEITEDALSEIADAPQEAAEKVKESLSRIKINHVDKLYWKYSREELEGMNNRSLRGLAKVRGVLRYDTIRRATLINKILAVHEQPTFDYPVNRARIITNELTKARKRFESRNLDNQ